MSQKHEANPSFGVPRLVNLDFLRGVFIFLALYQHYTVFINYWFVHYFKEQKFTNEFYSIFEGMMGVRIPADDLSVNFAWFFTTWVSQIYLTLAAFNLSTRTQEEFKKVYFTKLKLFAIIFLFFMIESFVVAPNLGFALSITPIMTWMVVLTLLAVIFRYFGEKGVLLLLAFSFVRWLTPMHFSLSIDFEVWMQNWIHPDFEYDARIEYFLTSGCLGFLLGRLYYGHQHGQKLLLSILPLGLLLALPWLIWGDPYTINRMNLFETEHQLAKDFLGSIYIYGVQLFLIPFFIIMEGRGVVFRIPFFHWLGVNSLTVFAFHRIYFIFIGGPLWAYLVAVVFDSPLSHQSVIIWFNIAICALFCLIFQKTKMAQILLRG